MWEDLSRTKEKITDADLLDVLRDSPVICRDQEAEKSATVSFMTMESFGNGNARGPVGRIPI
ncbi:MAG: hypothetical protein GY866_05850 [Proteobacteria bacterium]|nr:hypothetical protein [Pseudomonadota bacterium]